MQTLQFVQDELPRWRVRGDRQPEVDEEKLNVQLAKHLDRQARRRLQMVQFFHEEKQTGRRRVDISALPVAEDEEGDDLISLTYGSLDTPFLVFECKRLPAPPEHKHRVREYVRGFTPKGSPSGGIQRFKLGLHGAALEVAVMVGYVQSQTPFDWYEHINSWMRAFADESPVDTEEWTEDEQLQNYTETRPLAEPPTILATSRSSHPRSAGCTTSIRLYHFWITMV